MTPEHQLRTDASLKRDGRQHFKTILQRNRHWTDTQVASASANPPRSLGIVGAGVMGATIAAAALQNRISVLITDKSEQALATVGERIAGCLGRDNAASIESTYRQFVRTTREIDEVAHCDLVLESVIEDSLIKQLLLAQLESKLAPSAVLASNTSTIAIGRLAMKLADPGQFCGCHFFPPVDRQAMVEITRGPASRASTISTAVAFAKRIRHMPLVVEDAPGLLVNRLMVPYFSESLRLVTEGVSIDAIEAVAVDFGMTVGPLSLLDQVGLDTGMNCAWSMARCCAHVPVRLPLLTAMIKAGRLGRKSGAGFFAYESADTSAPHPRKMAARADREPAPSPCESRPSLPLPRPGWRDPAVDEIVERSSRPRTWYSRETIIGRLLAPLLLEATRMLHEGTARNPGQIDLAAISGIGFPTWRGGLLFWADTLGEQQIVTMLDAREKVHSNDESDRQAELLLERVRQGRRFYCETAGRTAAVA